MEGIGAGERDKVGDGKLSVPKEEEEWNRSLQVREKNEFSTGARSIA